MTPLDAELLYKLLLDNIKSSVNSQRFELVGLALGGAWLAERLAKDLGKDNFGIINTSYHRDDYAKKGVATLHASGQIPPPTRLPFEVCDAHIILVDDVLDTGRTVRAALNELFDYGRPAQVDLAVLVDRMRRELPIEARYASIRLRIPDEKVLALTQGSGGCFSFGLESIA